MIQKLRRKFIIVAMCSTLVVLTVIIGIANAVNYIRVIDRADHLLEILGDNDADFPLGTYHGKMPDGRPVKPEIEGMSPETPYETRFFSVSLDEQGQVAATDTGNIAALGDGEAAVYAQKIYHSGHQKGFVEEYRYKMFSKNGGALVIFVDCRRELESFRMSAAASTVISVIGFLAVLFLVVVFSKRVFQPVADSYERQKRFVTDAGHELKTPLTVISANVDVLEMEGEANVWTDSIRRQTHRLAALTEQLVELSKMDEGGSERQMADFPISDAVCGAIEPFLLPAESQGKTIHMNIEGNLTYYGDEHKIRQMVSLLLDNAVKYSLYNTAIEVCLKKEGKYYILTVYNETLEMPVGNLDILFERFYRLDASRSSDSGGSGIGLSIVKAIVEAHGGKATAVSRDGKSLMIAVRL